MEYLTLATAPLRSLFKNPKIVHVWALVLVTFFLVTCVLITVGAYLFIFSKEANADVPASQRADTKSTAGSIFDIVSARSTVSAMDSIIQSYGADVVAGDVEAPAISGEKKVRTNEVTNPLNSDVDAKQKAKDTNIQPI